MALAAPTERDPAHQRTAKARRPRRLTMLIILAVGTLVLLRAAIFVADAGLIGAGYAAKQICSGVFVARLPERFVMDNDVLPRLATVGPMAALLDYAVDPLQRRVSATLLGRRVIAQFEPSFGCTLFDEENDEQQSTTHSPLDALPEKSRVHLTSTPPQPAATQDRTPPSIGSSDATPKLDAALDAAFAEPFEGGRNTLAVVVMHQGKLVAERYQAPVSVMTPMQGWSMNKSLMATFIGHQIDAGRMSLDDSVSEALNTAGAEASLISLVSPDLTLGHLLSMTSGFDFAERYFPGDDVTDMLYRQPGMWLSAPATGHAHPPGEQFSYSSGDINTASLMWHQSLRGQRYTDWLADTFVAPLGLQEIVLEPDASGVQVGSSYAYLTARDWALMGQLWLDAWHGRNALISQAWQKRAVTPGTANQGEIYGLGFWLNTHQRRFPDAPESTFNAGGNSGQFVVVIPERELVIVRLGLTLNESRADMNVLLADVLAAL